MKLTKSLLLAAILLSNASLALANTHLLVRLRAIDVIPSPSSTTISLIGGHVDSVSSQVVPELDISYFFTDNIAAEIILGTMRHSVAATNTVFGRVDMGKVNLLPPTLTVQYHFMPERMISPYVGVGLNYTYFFNIADGPLALSTKYGSSFGPAVQAGVDIALNSHWSINVDVKKIYIRTHATVSTALGDLKSTAKLNPLIVGVGIGYKWDF